MSHSTLPENASEGRGEGAVREAEDAGWQMQERRETSA